MISDFGDWHLTRCYRGGRDNHCIDLIVASERLQEPGASDAAASSESRYNGNSERCNAGSRARSWRRAKSSNE